MQHVYIECLGYHYFCQARPSGFAILIEYTPNRAGKHQMTQVELDNFICQALLCWALNFAIVYVINDIMRKASVNGAAYWLSSSQDLLDSSLRKKKYDAMLMSYQNQKVAWLLLYYIKHVFFLMKLVERFVLRTYRKVPWQSSDASWHGRCLQSRQIARTHCALLETRK